MKYNLNEIGERLKKERKKAGFKSHDGLVDYIRNHNYRGFTRQTISKWERGLEMPPLDVLCSLCELFECELGYLLCEYDCKTRRNTDIHDETGLSDDAINGLRLLHFPIDSIWDETQISRYDITALNIILEDFYSKMKKTPDFKKFGNETDTLLNRIGQYIDSGSATLNIVQNGKSNLYPSDEIVQAICRDKITLLLNELRNKYSLDIIGKRNENKERFNKLFNASIKEHLTNEKNQDEKN